MDTVSKLLLGFAIFLLIIIGYTIGIKLYSGIKPNSSETTENAKKIHKNSYGQYFIRDTVFIHDTLYRWDIDTSKLKLKRTKLLCVDSYGTEGLSEGGIYTTSGNKFKDEDGVLCFYIDGLGPKKASRFTSLLETSEKD